MAIEIIDLGTVAQDGADGDVAREAFEKVNANFAEHESEIDAITPRLTTIETDVGQLEIQAGQIQGDLTNLTESFNVLSSEVGGNTADIQNLENSREYTLVPGEGITIDRTDPTTPVISSTGSSANVWGQITGEISDQTDLFDILESKASTSNLDSVEEKVDLILADDLANGGAGTVPYDEELVYPEGSVGDAILGMVPLTKLINSTSSENGAGLVGYNPDLDYVEGSVGAELKALAESSGGGTGIPGAAGDGVTDDTDAIQAAIDVSKGLLTFGSEKTYLITRGLTVEKPLIINLNGSTINGEFDVADPGIWVKSNTVQIGNGSIFLVGTIMGVHGGSLNCIYTGNEATGEGFYNLRYHDLTLSTNRNDAGATIGFLGENYNFIVENIKVPDNSQCRNIIGIEWSGTPSGGTGHPHNGIIRNIEIGRLTYPTFGADGYAYAVWISAAFNIKVENISMVQGYGLVMATRGDNAGTYAPERYRDRIGSGISVDNASISECFGYGLCVIGSHRSTEFRPAGFNVKFRGIRVIGKKTGGNANFGLVVDQTDGVSLEDFSFDGDITAGLTTVATNDNLKIAHGSILNSDVYGMSLSNDCRWPRVQDVHFKGNNKPGAAGAGLAAIYTGTCTNPVIDGCTFGELGVAETQKYSIFFDSATTRPKLSNNHTFALGSGGAAYIIGLSTEYGINANGSNNTAETGLVVHGGAPIFNVSGTGLRSFYSTAAPISGAWSRGEQVFNSLPATGSPRGWVCTAGGTPGSWVSMGNL